MSKFEHYSDDSGRVVGNPLMSRRNRNVPGWSHACLQCALRAGRRGTDNHSMSNRSISRRPKTQNEWQRRIARAEELGAQYSFAGEILRFYLVIARFQENFYEELGRSFERSSAGATRVESEPFARPLHPELTNRFGSFLSVVDENGPDPLREAARELRDGGADSHFQMLTVFWSGPTLYRCPFCKRKPGVGVLRPLGDGGQRSLVCSFCLAEWEFRRIVCPGCGEENPAKLPVYTAEELKHVRVEGCDSCRSYIKTVDLTKSGLAEPIVDEMAPIPLDLWPQKQGYTKLQCNLLQL